MNTIGADRSVAQCRRRGGVKVMVVKDGVALERRVAVGWQEAACRLSAV